MPTRPGFAPTSVAFSPDGARVAIAYDSTGPSVAAGFVEVVDLRSDRVATVQGVFPQPRVPASVAWTPDGRWLAIAVRFRRPGPASVHIALWPSTGGPVRVQAPVETPGAVDISLAAL